MLLLLPSGLEVPPLLRGLVEVPLLRGSEVEDVVVVVVVVSGPLGSVLAARMFYYGTNKTKDCRGL